MVDLGGGVYERNHVAERKREEKRKEKRKRREREGKEKGKKNEKKEKRLTGSNSARILSASFWLVTPASSIFLMPRTYLAKVLFSAASTGALSTETRLSMLSGLLRASVIAVLAPLRSQL